MSPPDAPNTFAEIGDLGHQPLTPEERNRRQRFALLWAPTRAQLERRGWINFSAGSLVELYVRHGSSRVLDWIWLSPTGDLLRVRMNFKSPQLLTATAASFDDFDPPGVSRANVTVERLKRTKGMEHVLEARASLRDLLDGSARAEEMAFRLQRFVVAVIAHAEASDQPAS